MTGWELIGAAVQPENLTFRQRWSHYIAVLYCLVAILIGLNLRDAALTATISYTNSQAGIRAQYPANWLIDESGDYIFRVRDLSRPGFKTTIQVATRPVSALTSTRNVLDALNLSRAQTLAAYEVLSEEFYALPNDVSATAMTYTFVDTQDNPFLQGIPVVVQGLDILTIRGGQALVITFLADASAFDRVKPVFDQFLDNLEF